MSDQMDALTRNGRYTFFGRYAPGDRYISMSDIGIDVHTIGRHTVRMRMKTILGHPIPYIPDRGVILFEGVGAIYRDGDVIRLGDCLSTCLNKSRSMRLMEIIEDGSKVQIVIEDVTPEDAEAVHLFQLAQGRGRLTISESGITFEV